VTDEISLTLPRERPFYGVADLVLGGLAVRLDLTFEQLQDLQLALAGLLERPAAAGEAPITVTIRIEDDTLRTVVGPFEGESLRAELERDSDRELTLRRLLETVSDGVELDEREGGQWVELTTRLARERV
jgi:hypothetical protein